MIDKIIYHKNLSYFVSSIIPLMSISIFLADLFVVILSLIFLIFILKNKMLTNFQNIFFILSLIFYMVCVTSSLLSEYILFSLKSSLTLIRVIILIIFISFLLEKKENFDQILYEYMKYTLFFLSFYGICFYIYEIIFYDPNYVRLKLPFTDEEKLGSYLIRLYPLLLALFLIKKNKTRNENIFFLFISLLVCLTVILSGERTAFFFLILVVSLCVIFIETKPKIKKIFFFTILICSAATLILSPNVSKRLLFDKFNQLNLTPDKLVIFTPHHTAHYLVAYKAFSEKPLIGHGPKTFRKICKKEEYGINDNKYLTEDLLQNNYSACATHPHNTYLQLLSETGIIGFFLFLLGFVHIIILMIRELFEIIFNSERKLGNYKLAVAISALIVFWPFSPSGNFFNNWVSIMNAITLGFYIHAFFLKKPFKGNII